MTLNQLKVLGICESRRDVEALRPYYERWQWLPNLDIDYFLDVLLAQPSVVRPYVIAVGRDNKPEALLVGRIVDKNLPMSIGSKPVMHNAVRVLEFRRGSLLGDECQPTAPILMDAILSSLAAGDADFAEFSNIEAESALFTASLERPGRLCRDAFVGLSHDWVLDLPATYEAFLKQRSSKTRYDLNNIERKFENHYAGRYEVKYLSKPGDLGLALESMENVARQTFQRRLGVGFSLSPEVLSYLKLSVERGWFQAQVAYIDNVPVAFGQGSLYKDKFFAEFTGYDRHFQKSSPGTYLMVRLLRDLFKQGNVARIHWGVGAEEYKARLSTRSIPSANIYIAAPRLKSIRIHCTRLALRSSVVGTKWMASRIGLAEWVQRRWKIHLRGHGKTLVSL